jgi:hypothetical protein
MDPSQELINEESVLKYIEQHPDSKLKWSIISMCNCLSVDFLRKYQDKLKWDTVSYRTNITMDIIEQNIDLPWSFESIAAGNPNITMDFIIKYNLTDPDIFCEPFFLAGNPVIDVQWVRKYPELMSIKGFWSSFSSKITISKEDVDNNPDLPWDPEGLSENQNILGKAGTYINYTIYKQIKHIKEMNFVREYEQKVYDVFICCDDLIRIILGYI